MPVPMAVAPRLISQSRARESASRASSSRKVVANAPSSWPTVIGTASCSWVRPIFGIARNSVALRRNASAKASVATASPSIAVTSAIRTAVG